MIGVVERWQSEQNAVDEVRASLAKAETRLDEAVLEAAGLGDRALVARLLDLPEAYVRKTISAARRGEKLRNSEVRPPNASPPPVEGTGRHLD